MKIHKRIAITLSVLFAAAAMLTIMGGCWESHDHDRGYDHDRSYHQDYNQGRDDHQDYGDENH